MSENKKRERSEKPATETVGMKRGRVSDGEESDPIVQEKFNVNCKEYTKIVGRKNIAVKGKLSVNYHYDLVRQCPDGTSKIEPILAQLVAIYRDDLIITYLISEGITTGTWEDLKSLSVKTICAVKSIKAKNASSVPETVKTIVAPAVDTPKPQVPAPEKPKDNPAPKQTILELDDNEDDGKTSHPNVLSGLLSGQNFMPDNDNKTSHHDARTLDAELQTHEQYASQSDDIDTLNLDDGIISAMLYTASNDANNLSSRDIGKRGHYNMQDKLRLTEHENYQKDKRLEELSSALRAREDEISKLHHSLKMKDGMISSLNSEKDHVHLQLKNVIDLAKEEGTKSSHNADTDACAHTISRIMQQLQIVHSPEFVLSLETFITEIDGFKRNVDQLQEALRTIHGQMSAGQRVAYQYGVSPSIEVIKNSIRKHNTSNQHHDSAMQDDIMIPFEVIPGFGVTNAGQVNNAYYYEK